MASNDDLAQLGFLIGTWDTTILAADGTAPTSAIDIYAWSANGQFIEHQVTADLGTGPPVQSLEVIAASGVGTFTSHSFDPDGSVNTFALTLTGRDWSIVGQAQRFSGSFDASFTRLDGEWEQKSDEQGWHSLMTIALRKRPA